MSEIEAGLLCSCGMIRATKGEGGLEVASGKSTISSNNKRRVWTKEAGECAAMGAVECARALHELVLNEFGGRRDVWLEAAKFERSLATDTDEAGEANAHEGDKSAGVLKSQVQVTVWLPSCDSWSARPKMYALAHGCEECGKRTRM